MADPIGELEELIEQALNADMGALNAHECAIYLAARLAPQVVLRTQLEHAGWLKPEHVDEDGDEIDATFWTVEEAEQPSFTTYMKDSSPVFLIPPRVVQGTTELILGGNIGGDAT